MPFTQKLLVVWLVLFSSCIQLSAQKIGEKEKLKAIFSKIKQDTSTVSAWIDYGKIIQDKSIDSANLYFQKAFTLSKKLNFKRGIYRSYSNIIFLKGNRKENIQDALKLSREFESFSLKEKNERYLADAYFAYATTYQNAEQYDSSVHYYEKVLNLYEKQHNYTDIPIIYGNLSSIYHSQKMLDIAMEYNEKALKTDIKSRDTLRIISDYINRSLIYFDKNDKVGEEKCNREALRLSELMKSPYRIMIASGNLGAMFEDRQMFDSALFFMQKAYQLSKICGAENNAVRYLLKIAHSYSKKKDFQKANQYLQLAIKHPEINYLSVEQQLFFTELKISIFKGIGKYKEASHLLIDYNKLTDSVNTISTKERILEFNNKLKKAESEKIILGKQVEIDKQKFWIYLLTISGITLLLLGFLFYRYQNKKQEAKNQQIKLLEQENEFISVKSSLEGQLNERVRISKEIHDDLGSSLTSISLLTEVLKIKVDGTKIPEVGKISATSARMVDSMNEIVWALNVHNDTLDSLIAFIRKYARDFLQDTPIKLVFEEDVNQDFALQGNVRRSIYLVVKEAINNVVKHADAQQVSLNIQVENNKLIIHIEDDGNGINVDKKSVFSNGLRNMKQRMEDIGGTFSMYQTKGMVVSIEYSF
jgi:signal transduction histidine kinase